MVNIVFHSVDAATDTDDSRDELEAQEDLLNDPVYDEVNPEVSQSSSRGWFPKKLFKSFGAVTNIKRRGGKHNSEKVEFFLSDIAEEKPKRFSSKEIKTFTLNFSDLIGEGGYAKIYRGKITNEVQVAVKVLKDKSFNNIEFMAEVSTLGRTYHRNIVKLLGFCFGKKMKALVYEYMENGSLDRFLFSPCSHSIDWEKLYGIILGVAKGLSYLHECCDLVIIHHDIKPYNILLDSNFRPKISDFGLSQLEDRDKMPTLVCIRGTYGYVAPEFFTSSSPVTHKCDVFGFGMTLFEIVGKRKNIDVNVESLEMIYFPKYVWDNFEKGKLEEFIIELGMDVKDREQAKKVFMVALWCIQDRPEDRPSMSSVVKILEGEIEITEPPCPSRFMAFPTEDSQVSITMHSDSMIVQEMVERDSEDFSRVVDCVIELFTPTMEKFEIKIASSSESYELFTPTMEKFEIKMASSSESTRVK